MYSVKTGNFFKPLKTTKFDRVQDATAFAREYLKGKNDLLEVARIYRKDERIRTCCINILGEVVII